MIIRRGWIGLFGIALVVSCDWIAPIDRSLIDDNAGGAGGTITGTGAGGTSGSTGGTGGTTSGGGTGGTTNTCDPAQCPAPSSICKVAYCDDNAQCAEKNVDDGTATANQITGDCKKNVCMGGAETSTNDDTDVEDDSKSCTTDSCNGGSPAHDPVTSGKTCMDGGNVCDDAGNCVECNIDADCTAAAPKTVCDPTHVCVLPHCSNGTKDADETDMDCGGNDCGKCADTLGCMDANDCQSNNCVTNACVAGTCGDGIINNTQLGETDVDCGGGCPDCGFNKNCDVNGDCKSGNCTSNKCAASCGDGEKDQDESDIDCGGICSDCANTQSCNTKADCQSNFCNAQMKCAACSSNANCAAAEYCNAGGVCVNDKVSGLTCTMGAQCQSNNCVDGTCCGSATCGTCQACSVSGSEGTCTNVGAGLNDDTCLQASNKQCDGAGACKSVNGQTCAMGVDCLSGNCVDGVCCSSTCTGVCKSCNVAGSVGSCSNVPAGQEDNFPANACNGVNSCDGSGNLAAACKKDVGQPCAGGTECTNGNCVDSFCCGSASCLECQSCGIAGTEGTCTNIGVGDTDTVPANTCVGNNACNGQNGPTACKLANGQTCAVNGDCASNNCASLVCAP